MNRHPDAPWDPPSTAPVVPCSGCQNTGRIVALDGNIHPCDLCMSQRAIDAAVVTRMRMEGRDLTDWKTHASKKTLSVPCSFCLGSGDPCACNDGIGRQLIKNEAPVTLPAIAIANHTPTARILEMSAAKYHTDPIDQDIPSLSNSTASTIVIDAPYIAWLTHPRLGNVPLPPTKSMERGTLIHAATLENGRGFACLPFDNWRTDASKEARDEARANGLLPMLAREYEPLMAIGQDIRDTLADSGMRLRGKSEVVVTWHEQSRLGSVLCRGMMDHLIVDPHSAEIIDLKIISSADKKTCIRHIWEFGYDSQYAAYTSAIEKLYPHLAGRIRFRFAFCQVMPAKSPRRVLITPIELNGEFRALGRLRWQSAVETWAKCLKTDQWPGYVPDGHTEVVAPAPYMLTGEMDAQRAKKAEEDSDDDEENQTEN